MSTSNNQGHHGSEIEKLGDEIEHLSAKCALLSIECDRLNSQLADKDEEITSLKKIIANLEQKSNSEAEVRALQILLQDYEKKIATMAKENKNLAERMRTEGQTNNTLTAYVNHIQELEHMVSNLKAENEQLNLIIREKLVGEEKYKSSGATIQLYEHRIQGLVEQVSQLNSELQRNRSNESKVHEYEATIQTLQQRLERAGREKERLEIDNRRLQEVIRNLEGATVKLNEYDKTFHDMSEEINMWRLRCDNLGVQKDEEIRRCKIEMEKTLTLRFEGDMKARTEIFDKERAEYEQMIKAFKEKFNEFERKLHLLVHENERLRTQVSDKEKEIEILKKSESYQREIEELKRRLSQLQESAEEERRGLIARIQEGEAKLVIQTTEISRLTSGLFQKDAEIEQLKKKIFEVEQDSQDYIEKTLAEIEVQFKERLEIEKKEFYHSVVGGKEQSERQSMTFISKIKESESEITRLIDANERLTSQLEQMSEEIMTLKIKIEGLTKDKDHQFEDFRARLEDEKRLLIERESKVIELKFKERIDGYEEQIKTLRGRVQDFETRQILFFIEIERLYAINTDFINELNRMSADIQDLTQENGALTKKLAEQHQSTLGIREERIRFEATIGDLNHQIEDYERRIQVLLNENSRLSDLSIARLKEIDELKHTFNSGSPSRDDPNSSKQLENLKKAHTDLREMALMFETEKNNMEAQLKQLKHVIDLNRIEITRLQDINQQRRAENEALHMELEKLRNSSEAIARLESELRFKSQQYEQLMKEVEELKRNREFYRQQLEQLSAKPRDSNGTTPRQSYGGTGSLLNKSNGSVSPDKLI